VAIEEITAEEAKKVEKMKIPDFEEWAVRIGYNTKELGRHNPDVLREARSWYEKLVRDTSNRKRPKTVSPTVVKMDAYAPYLRFPRDARNDYHVSEPMSSRAALETTNIFFGV